MNKELVDFIENELNKREYLDYHDWDGFIEDEEHKFTEEDLDWVRENYKVKSTLVHTDDSE